MSTKKLDAKQSCRLATTGTIPNLSNLPIDFVEDITLNEGDRILVKDGASRNGIELASHRRNGIYYVKEIVGGYAELERAKDANKSSGDSDKDACVSAGLFVVIEEGAINGDSGWVLTTDNPIYLESTDLVFKSFFGGQFRLKSSVRC
jgi:hypothetical protein